MTKKQYKQLLQISLYLIATLLFLFNNRKLIDYLIHHKCLHLFPSNLAETTLLPDLDETYSTIYTKMMEYNEAMELYAKIFEGSQNGRQLYDEMGEKKQQEINIQLYTFVLLQKKLAKASGTQRALQATLDLEDHCPTGITNY